MTNPRRTHPLLTASKKSSIRIRSATQRGSAFRMPRRQHITVLTIIALAAFLCVSFFWTFHNHGERKAALEFDYKNRPIEQEPVLLDEGILLGTSTTAKLENATLKAELGNAAWKLLHTTMAKFPDKPTADDSQALTSYIHLFARLYPCGDCARHFQQILKKYPPQVATRSTAAAWACHVHNEVNKSLKKTLFDCTKIGDFYDCGCAEDGEEKAGGKEKKGEKWKKGEKGKKGKRKDGFTALELEKEGLTRGG